MKLVIAEKPSVAMDIAKVIGATQKKDGYMEGGNYLVTWCIGHLVIQKTPEDYSPDLKKWEMKTLPFIPERYEYKVADKTKKQFYIIKKLMEDKRIDSVVCATDAGREGELIFRLVYMAAGCTKNMERLWISSMTDKAIKKGFDELKPGSEYNNLYKAALARANADMCLGINGTRLFSIVYNKLLKTGRVKSPTLAMVVKRENEINNFVKEPYYVIHLINDALQINAKSEHIKDKKQAEGLLATLSGKPGKVTSVTEEKKSLKAPRLYNLSTLQIDANKYFGYSADETLNILQTLYEKHKIATYPRTDAEYLTEDMEESVKGLLMKIRNKDDFNCFKSLPGDNVNILLNSKKVSDHHALLPTENVGNFNFSVLNEKEKNMIFLIIGRLMCAVGAAQEYITTKIEISVGEEVFIDTSKVVTSKGWKATEEALKKLLGISDPSGNEDRFVERIPLAEGDEISDITWEITDHETKPSSRYTEGDLIKAMDKAGVKDLDKDAERQGLGTSATRAGIIAEIKKDGLFLTKGKYLYPSEDAFKFVEVLPDELKSVDMTVEWENKLVQISKGDFSYDAFMKEIEDFVKFMVENYRTPKSGVVFENAGNTGKLNVPYLGVCPNCGDKVLMGKYGAYCNGKCGIMLNKTYGKALTDVHIKSILSGKKTLLKGLTSSKGSTYDMYVTMKGVKDYSYTDKDGKKHDGKVLDYETSFPDDKYYEKALYGKRGGV